jgi:hypothetical protein
MERSKTCEGCIYDSLGQRDHMGYGGCLSDDLEDTTKLPVYINGVKYYYSLLDKNLYNSHNQIICGYDFGKGLLVPINP